MLSSCLQHPEILGHTKELFFIDFNKKPIKVKQVNDLITPLIIVQFLRVVKQIVKKGLQKGYYPITDNLRSKVKGKILVARTINRNHLKNDLLHTWCTYQEYGLNNPQNRLLKRAMKFIKRYVQVIGENGLNISNVLSFIDPAFEEVSEKIEVHEIAHFRINPFFSEYGEAIMLAKLILRRFGFHINSVRSDGFIEVPPFWVDMSKLFELYVLGKLKDALKPGEVIYQARGEYGELDFLRNTKGEEIIIDAKYKPVYANGNKYDIDNIRQLSAYGRDKGLLRQLAIDEDKWDTTVLPCLIIHPKQDADTDIVKENLLNHPIKQFEQFYKLGIKIPTINSLLTSQL